MILLSSERRDGRKCERVFMCGWLKDMFLAGS
jgi:hypothetical protein